MLRYIYLVGKDQPMDTFTDWRIPIDILKYAQNNKSNLLGVIHSDRDLKSSEIININNSEYIHVSSRKYYKGKNAEGFLESICELTFVQSVLYEEKKNDNV